MNAGNTEVANAPCVASVRWSAVRPPWSSPPPERSQLLDVSSCYRAVTAPLSSVQTAAYKTWLLANRMTILLVPMFECWMSCWLKFMIGTCPSCSSGNARVVHPPPQWTPGRKGGWMRWGQLLKIFGEDCIVDIRSFQIQIKSSIPLVKNWSYSCLSQP